MPARLTRPYVGLIPVIPQSAEGAQIEPAVSVPVPPRMRPAATAAPVPLDDPPVARSRFQGFFGGGQGRSKPAPVANSLLASLPTITVPASASRATVVASDAGTLSASSREFPVV